MSAKSLRKRVRAARTSADLSRSRGVDTETDPETEFDAVPETGSAEATLDVNPGGVDAVTPDDPRD